MDNVKLNISILAPLDLVWECFTDRDHIEEWYFASEDWHCPNAENNFEIGGSFNYRMEAKDGSFGFNFTGIFDEIKPNSEIKYYLDDGRKVEVRFVNDAENTVNMHQEFEPEGENPANLQRNGWYAILDNFRNYVEKIKNEDQFSSNLP